MARYQGKTTERGYGAQHQATLKRERAAFRAGQPCARCGQPIWSLWMLDASGRRVSAVDLGHNDGRDGYIGLEHRRCNRRDGQRKTTAILRARGGPTPRQVAAIRMRQWAAATATGTTPRRPRR